MGPAMRPRRGISMEYVCAAIAPYEEEMPMWFLESLYLCGWWTSLKECPSRAEASCGGFEESSRDLKWS